MDDSPSTTGLALIAGIYALLFFNAAVHGLVKRRLMPKADDHLIDIVIHSVHITWISACSLVIVVLEYPARSQDALTLFPALFIATFYVHELNVRRMTLDIKAHHVAVVIVVLVAIHDEVVIIYDVFNIIEFGHLFHFVPYIMYKTGRPLARVLRAADIACVGFFVVRILGFAGVSAFVVHTNWAYFMSYSPLRQGVVAGSVGVLFGLQFWMYRDVVHSRNEVRRKLAA